MQRLRDRAGLSTKWEIYIYIHIYIHIHIHIYISISWKVQDSEEKGQNYSKKERELL